MNINKQRIIEWLDKWQGIIAMLFWMLMVVYSPFALIYNQIPIYGISLLFLFGLVFYFRWAVTGGLPPRC